MQINRKNIFIISIFILHQYPLFGLDKSIGYISSLTVPWYSGSGWDYSFQSHADEDHPQAELKNNPIVGFSMGIIGEYPLNRYISLRSEVLLSALGGGYVYAYPDGNTDAVLISEINLGIPFSLKLNLLTVRSNVLYLTGGAQISTLLHQAEYSQSGPVFQKEELERDQFTTLNFAGIGGLGLDVPHKNHVIFLELSYLRELNSTFRNKVSVYQNVLKMSCGIRWIF